MKATTTTLELAKEFDAKFLQAEAAIKATPRLTFHKNRLRRILRYLGRLVETEPAISHQTNGFTGPERKKEDTKKPDHLPNI